MSNATRRKRRPNRRATQSKKRPEAIAAEIRGELREIIRMWEELCSPLPTMPFWHPVDGQMYAVMFDMRPPRIARTSLKIGMRTLSLHHERTRTRVLDLAGAVWHLWDRLHQWAKATGNALDVRRYADGRPRLVVCADLANRRKHGHSDRSRLDPRLGQVAFDTSNSGVSLYAYDGAAKEDTFAVSKPAPISYTVELALADTPIPDAVDFIWRAFLEWLPLINELGILAPDEAENRHLRKRLAQLAATS